MIFNLKRTLRSRNFNVRLRKNILRRNKFGGIIETFGGFIIFKLNDQVV